VILDTILAKVIGTQNERELKRLRPLVTAINEREAGLTPLGDAAPRPAKRSTICSPTPSRSCARRAAACSACGTSTSSSSAAWCSTPDASPR
jgi:hypothetical protein